MLMSILRALINNPIKEIFYGEKKKINILTVFSFLIKNDVKTLLKWIVNEYPKGTR